MVPKKPKVRRVELKLVPVLDRLNVEDVAENNTYQRMNRLMDQAFEAVDDMDLNPDNGKPHLPHRRSLTIEVIYIFL